MQKEPNRLISESSPYLLQHAYNPVDWHPWNEETLAIAKQQNKIMLVSIGYSACHWCHVMEHESFEDAAMAEIMNRHFICIKVDREERPDVDHFFMEAVQLIGGRGGWPLNCFALPDGRPVWGGTYFRKEQWKSILLHIANLWEEQSDDLLGQAAQLVEALGNIQKNQVPAETPSASSVLTSMAAKLKQEFDLQHGGSGGAPKFPLPGKWAFVLLLAQHFDDATTFEQVKLSLRKMAYGGIYDQLGGGFSRYSVDERWHVPHFEKMLYDNAQLISLYSDAYRQFQAPLYKEVVSETIAFLMREMKSPDACFYSALDADSEGVEGKFYVWTKAEFDEVLGKDAPLVSAYFGIDREAHWENGLNVLVKTTGQDEFAQMQKLPSADFAKLLASSKEKLLAYRTKRIRPGLDDKQLVSWNALTISALAKAAVVFDKEAWMATARECTDFILAEMKTPDGGLYRTWKNGQAKIPAFLDDYSLFITALIDLFMVDGDEKYLNEAANLLALTIENFYKKEDGIFSFTAKTQQDLAVAPRETYDNVIPSSNAVMCHNLVRMSMLFENNGYLQMAETMLKQQCAQMQKYPGGFFHWGKALWLLEHQPLVVIRGENAKKAAQSLYKNLPPGLLMVFAEGSSGVPAIEGKNLNDKLQYWYCDQRGCRLPVGHQDALLALVEASIRQ